MATQESDGVIRKACFMCEAYKKKNESIGICKWSRGEIVLENNVCGQFQRKGKDEVVENLK